MFGILCTNQLLSDICKWLIEEEDAEAVEGATTHYHRPLTNEPSWRLLVLRLPPLHRLVQLWTREGRVTSRGSKHIILKPSREEGIRWKLIIGFGCDAPKPRSPLTNRQPAENSCISGDPIPHYVSHLSRSTNLTTKWPLQVHLSIFI